MNHPIGIQPWGNYFLKDIKEDIRKSGKIYITNFKHLIPFNLPGLGKLNKLSDEIILEILTYLKSEDIGRISCLSKAWYCFSYFEDIWKSQVLKVIFFNDPQINIIYKKEFEGNFKYYQTWRNTYVYNKYNISYKPYPIKISGFYSDILYTPWFCARFPISNSWLENDDIKRQV